MFLNIVFFNVYKKLQVNKKYIYSKTTLKMENFNVISRAFFKENVRNCMGL